MVSQHPLVGISVIRCLQVVPGSDQGARDRGAKQGRGGQRRWAGQPQCALCADEGLRRPGHRVLLQLRQPQGARAGQREGQPGLLLGAPAAPGLPCLMPHQLCDGNSVSFAWLCMGKRDEHHLHQGRLKWGQICCEGAASWPAARLAWSCTGIPCRLSENMLTSVKGRVRDKAAGVRLPCTKAGPDARRQGGKVQARPGAGPAWASAGHPCSTRGGARHVRLQGFCKLQQGCSR